MDASTPECAHEWSKHGPVQPPSRQTRVNGYPKSIVAVSITIYTSIFHSIMILLSYNQTILIHPISRIIALQELLYRLPLPLVLPTQQACFGMRACERPSQRGTIIVGCRDYVIFLSDSIKNDAAFAEQSITLLDNRLANVTRPIKSLKKSSIL